MYAYQTILWGFVGLAGIAGLVVLPLLPGWLRLRRLGLSVPLARVFGLKLNKINLSEFIPVCASASSLAEASTAEEVVDCLQLVAMCGGDLQAVEEDLREDGYGGSDLRDACDASIVGVRLKVWRGGLSELNAKHKGSAAAWQVWPDRIPASLDEVVQWVRDEEVPFSSYVFEPSRKEWVCLFHVEAIRSEVKRILVARTYGLPRQGQTAKIENSSDGGPQGHISTYNIDETSGRERGNCA